MKNDDEISGALPQFVIAPTRKGRWACFWLSSDGFRRLTLSAYTPLDAARLMVDYFERNPQAVDAAAELLSARNER